MGSEQAVLSGATGSPATTMTTPTTNDDDEQRRDVGAALARSPPVLGCVAAGRFPRTLEELEHVDILRLLRARQRCR